MKRNVLAALLVLGLAAPAMARTVEERLIAGLVAQGYVIVEDGYTWLGRLRIVAESATYHREIVVNPETGEVLRDYAVSMADYGSQRNATAVASSGSGSGSSGSSSSAVAGVVAGETEPTVSSGLPVLSSDGDDATRAAATAESDIVLDDPVMSLAPGSP